MGDKSRIYLVSTTDRITGVRRCLNAIGALNYEDKSVFIKPISNRNRSCVLSS